MPTGLVARAFERAIQGERPSAGLLHHSDRGSQYARDASGARLRSHGVVASMSRAGNCDGQRQDGELPGHAQERADPRQDLRLARPEAKSEIFWYIAVFYNRTQLHGALGYHSPVDFENSLS